MTDTSPGEVDISRMTDRARGVLHLAAVQAAQRGATSIEPEHLLLALAMEEGGVAGCVLRFLGVTARRIEESMPPARTDASQSPESPRWSVETVRCVDRARDEMSPLYHNDVGTEHLILGVVLGGEGRVPEILSHLNVVAGDIRDEVYQLLGHQP